MGAFNCKNDSSLMRDERYHKDTDPVKFVNLGRHGSGKSSLIHRLQYGEPPKDYPYAEHFLFHRDGVHLCAWDYTGRGHYDFDSRFYIRGSSGIIFMIDCADARIFDDAVEFLETVLDDESICNTTIMVCANKQDLDDAVGPEVVEENIVQHCKVKRDNTLFVMPTSVTNKDDDSVEVAFRYFFKTMKRKAKGKIQTGLIPRAWETAEKVAEDSDGEDEDGKDVTEAKKGKKKFLLKDPVHMFKSLLIR